METIFPTMSQLMYSFSLKLDMKLSVSSTGNINDPHPPITNKL